MAQVPLYSKLARGLKIGTNLDDAQDIRLQKSLLVMASYMFIPLTIMWGIAYFLLGVPLAAIVPLSYTVISLASLVHFSLTHQYRVFRTSQLVLILVLPSLVMQALGGFIGSSAVILWSFISPLGALLFAEYKQAPRWLVAYLVLLILSAVVQSQFSVTKQLPQQVVTIFYVLNIGAVSTFSFILLHYFVGQKEKAYRLLHIEQNRSENLLLNVLPKEIAERLKGDEHTIADYYPAVSILFADMVGFTKLTTLLPPKGMVDLLNKIYSQFDSLVEEYGAEKIRTIGDNYMVACGVPRPREDHAQVMARLALEMKAYVESLAPVEDQAVSFRIGINSGPVVAGVIGQKKFAYDVWGDTVNVASRMESQGQPGKIQITQATYELLRDSFVCESTGALLVKGKGAMETWFLMRIANGGQNQPTQENIERRDAI